MLGYNQILFLKYIVTNKNFYCLDESSYDWIEVEVIFEHENDIELTVVWFIEISLDFSKKEEFHFEYTGKREGNKVYFKDPFISMIVRNKEIESLSPLKTLVKALAYNIGET